jgi:hypothetical protein
MPWPQAGKGRENGMVPAVVQMKFQEFRVGRAAKLQEKAAFLTRIRMNIAMSVAGS